MDNNFKTFILGILLLLTIAEYKEHKLIIQKLNRIEDEFAEKLQKIFYMQCKRKR